MTKQERTERGEVHRGKLSGAIHDDAVRSAGIGVDGASPSTQADYNRRVACSTLSHLFMREDGWLRAIPADGGKSLYLKWKYTRGQWRGRYVMTRVEVWQWDYGLQLLADKIEAVDDGHKIPTVDRPYDEDEIARNELQ